MATPTQVKTTTVDNGIQVFYREAFPASVENPSNSPTVLLLHGFPSSSFQYRNLIPILAVKYRVIAPDLPGYGFTVVPDERKYKYTFESLTKTMGEFLDALAIKKFAVYVFDYGAPVGYRLALQRPEAITTIISQNGNAYEAGFGQEFWSGVRATWADPSEENIKKLESTITSFDVTKWQYTDGAPNAASIPPETYTLDYYLMTRPGNAQIQTALIIDYQTNVALYPAFHTYFRERQPPLLAMWGKNDTIFIPDGALAYKNDLPKAVIKFVDGGHFALESAVREIGDSILSFLAENRV